MIPRTHIVERAYQLARSPDCTSVSDIISSLSSEGYGATDIRHLSGGVIRADLRRILLGPRS